ncbi:hypothetical protein [Deinococcus arenicola]|uniref:Uncharacterized protein n=1 Tax=Deinococcus arenicola TaxID=2994950 RepID=A0ABU4DSD2_9DEIO|nr:hypothetical protein [Deinococcus sp. ZS9-10]MDV6375298.1 hypothetical protein [Deinococcus sp. ZS9-10]
MARDAAKRPDLGDKSGKIRPVHGKAWTGTLFYSKADNVMIYDMSDGQVFITCGFDQKGVKGRSMQGVAFYQKGEKAESEDAGACAATP